ncbi:hypothetical protein [Nocardioides fonticola]|uniref:TY-Chap2 family putative peptide chaperone n=1 Tax=Nocardioides fonticola TaxID=450363 RepID=UPI0031DC9252
MIEAASWRLAVTLVRRHRDLVIGREHPGGGQYDCLAIRSDAGLLVYLNRVGSIQVHKDSRGGPLPVGVPVAHWDDYLSAADPLEIIRRIESTASLPSPQTALSSTPRILAYRLIADFAAMAVMSRPLEIRPCGIGSSIDGGPAEWLEDHPRIARELAARHAGPQDYWLVRGRGIDVVLDVRGRAVSPDDREIDLGTLYVGLGHSLPRLAARVIEECRSPAEPGPVVLTSCELCSLEFDASRNFWRDQLCPRCSDEIAV